MAVRVLHRIADVGDERGTGRHRQAAAPAPFGDRGALDVLHHEVRTPVGRDPAVEESRDAGMLQPGENLPLGEEPPEDLAARHDLDGNALLELPVGALAEVDDTHPAAADLAD